MVIERLRDRAWRRLPTKPSVRRDLKAMDELATLQIREAASRRRNREHGNRSDVRTRTATRRPAVGPQARARRDGLGKDAFLQAAGHPDAEPGPDQAADRTRSSSRSWRTFSSLEQMQQINTAITSMSTFFDERYAQTDHGHRTPDVRETEGKASMAVGSFSAGLSGLSANQQALERHRQQSREHEYGRLQGQHVTFEDLVNQNVGGSSENPDADRPRRRHRGDHADVRAGDIEASRVSTNVAIQGNGFFMLDGSAGHVIHARRRFQLRQATARWSRRMARSVLGYTAIDPVTRQIITTGQPTEIIVPPGLLRRRRRRRQFAMLHEPRCAGDCRRRRSPRRSRCTTRSAPRTSRP